MYLEKGNSFEIIKQRITNDTTLGAIKKAHELISHQQKWDNRNVNGDILELREDEIYYNSKTKTIGEIFAKPNNKMDVTHAVVHVRNQNMSDISWILQCVYLNEFGGAIKHKSRYKFDKDFFPMETVEIDTIDELLIIDKEK